MTRSLYESEARTDAAARADLIIFDGTSTQGIPAAPTLSFGAGLPLPGFPAGRDEGDRGYFVSWRRTHSLLRDLSLDGVYVSRAITLPESLPGAATTDLARGPDGPWIIETAQGLSRRLIVAFRPADSTWPLNAGFPIFLASAIDYLTLHGDESAGIAFTTAEAAQLDIPGAHGSVTLEGPITVAGEAPADGGPVELGRLERAGVYRVASAPVTVPPTARAVAVNLFDPVESTLAVRDTLQVGGDVIAAQTAASGPRELWPWAVLAALVLLTVEWFLNAWLMRA
jgi:hypothetical protein